MIRKGDITKMARKPIDGQSLLALVAKTMSRFPPQKDSDNVRSFRSISVDCLEGKITYPQFNLLYTKEKTAEQLTGEILDILNARLPRMPVRPGRVGEVPPKKWHIPGHTSRRF
jgi:hypothetical protein